MIQKPQGKGSAKELVVLEIRLGVLILMDSFPKTNPHPLSIQYYPSDIPPCSCPRWRGYGNAVVNLKSSTAEQKAGLCGVIILGIASNPLRLHLTLPTMPKCPIGSTSKSPYRASKTALSRFHQHARKVGELGHMCSAWRTPSYVSVRYSAFGEFHKRQSPTTTVSISPDLLFQTRHILTKRHMVGQVC